MKRLGIYKITREFHTPSITRKHTMRITRLRESINNKNNLDINVANK